MTRNLTADISDLFFIKILLRNKKNLSIKNLFDGLFFLNFKSVFLLLPIIFRKADARFRLLVCSAAPVSKK